MAAATSRKKPAQTLLGTQMQAQAEQAAELLKALSNPQRLRVMCMLIDSEKTVGEINAEIELSQSALSQHLAVLREGGWVQTRRESQNVYYSVTEGPVHKLIQTLHDIYCPSSGADDDTLC